MPRKGYERSVVDVAPFRDAAVHEVGCGRLTWSELARRFYPHQPAHASGIKRFLGLEWYYVNGVRVRRRHIHYQTAVRLCEALQLDPWEVGI